jgi:hypothetical protein
MRLLKNILWGIDLVALIVFLLFAGCKEGDNTFNCFEQSGNMVTITKFPGSFRAVIINDIFDVTLVQDSVDFVEITCGDNLAGDVELTVITDSLFLKNNNRCSWVREYTKIKVTIHFVNLKLLVTGCSCSVNTKGPIYSDDLMVAATGGFSEVDLELNTRQIYFYNNKEVTGIYKFRGNTQQAVLRTFGTASLFSDSLNAINLKAENNSVADMKVFATEKLEAILTSNGNIYYYGNPTQVDLLEQSSSGKLIKAE